MIWRCFVYIILCSQDSEVCKTVLVMLLLLPSLLLFCRRTWASVGHVPHMQSHEGTAGPPACTWVCIWTALADTLPSRTQEPKHEAPCWHASCGAHSPCPVGSTHVLVESGRPPLHHLPLGVRPHTPMLRLPTPGKCVFILQIIRGPDKKKLPMTDTRPTRLLVYGGCGQSRLENFDHFNLLYPVCLLYSAGTFIKPWAVVLIFLFSM